MIKTALAVITSLTLTIPCQAAEDVSPNSLAMEYTSQLRTFSLIELTAAYIKAPYQSREECCVREVLYSRLPNETVAARLNITDRLDPDDGLYLMFYNSLMKQGVNPLKRIDSGRLMGLIERDSAAPGWRGLLLSELNDRLPKMPNTDIAKMLEILPPMSQCRLMLTQERQRRQHS